jgi:two-component system C4-dicarboxylate transport sensor histidine kinase DctB
MEQSLVKALTAEATLEKEKASLAQKLEEQIQIVRKSQHEEIMQLYRFAELGQLTTVILHEMANNLSVLALDIDDMHKENQTSEAITRTKESIKYLENMVTKVRRQLNKTDGIERFNASSTIIKTVEELSSKAARSGVVIRRPTRLKKFYLIGDPLRLSQILTILVNNSIDASSQNNTLKEVYISTRITNKKLEISVIDYGVGVPEGIRKNLFEPLHSTKQNGLGIGLFIAKQIVETHFKGQLVLNPSLERTEFIVRLFKR